MRVYYTQDSEDMYTLHTEAVDVLSTESLEQWERALRAASDELLASRHGRKWLCLISIEGFSLSPELAAAYGSRAKSVIGDYFTGAIRYGSPEGICSTSAVRLGAIKNSFPSNIFRDRDAALIAVENLFPSASEKPPR